MANELQVWSPFRELDRVRRDFDDFFDRFFGGRPLSSMAQGTIVPALESFVEDGKLMVRADMPGIDPKSVEVTVIGDQLTIRGKREEKREEKRRDFVHREVSYGNFERMMRLPEGVKPEDVKAAYRNGVLELTIPLPEKSQGHKVAVQIEGGESERGQQTAAEQTAGQQSDGHQAER